jgi:hypothetical protein
MDSKWAHSKVLLWELQKDSMWDHNSARPWEPVKAQCWVELKEPRREQQMAAQKELKEPLTEPAWENQTQLGQGWGTSLVYGMELLWAFRLAGKKALCLGARMGTKMDWMGAQMDRRLAWMGEWLGARMELKRPLLY